MSSGVRRMLRAAFRVTVRQQVGAIPADDFVQYVRVQHILMEGVHGAAAKRVVNQAAIRFRPQGTVYKPLLVERGLEPGDPDFAQQRENVLISKSDRPILIGGSTVWVAGIGG